MKGAPAWPNRVRSYISLLSLCPNRNIDKLLFATVYVDVIFFPFRHNAQYLTSRPDHPNREALDIQSLACCANSIIFVAFDLRCHGCLSVCSLCCPFSKTKDSVCRFCMGFMIDSFFLSRKGEENKEVNHW